MISYRLLLLLSIFVLLMLGGCGRELEWFEGSNNFTVSANPLCEDVPGNIVGADGLCVAPSFYNGYSPPKPPPSGNAGTGQQTAVSGQTTPGTSTPNTATSSRSPNADLAHVTEREYLGRVVNESEYNCGTFLNGLTLASNTTNVGLDIVTTISSALGTVFTPLGTVHAFTAVGSISSGSKTAIDADIYAKQTVANYAQAIQSTYYTLIGNYVDQLSKVTDESTLVESLEISKIRTIHKYCTLASAQATISATLQPAQTTQTPSTVTVTVGSPITAGSTYSVTGTGTATPPVPATPLVASYLAAAGDMPPIVAAKLVLFILNPANGFAAAGITASLASANSPSFTIVGPATIKWTGSPAGTITISASAGSKTSGTTSSPPPPGSSIATTTGK